MKHSRLAIALATSLLAAMLAHASDSAPEFIEQIPIFGKTPPTAHWIWYVIAGQKDTIAPVLYISTQHFKTTLPEVLIVLPRAKYNIVSHLSKNGWQHQIVHLRYKNRYPPMQCKFSIITEGAPVPA